MPIDNSHDNLIRDLFVLQRVAQKINSNLDLDSLLNEIVNDVSQTFGCSRLAVLLKDERTNELVVGADCGGDANQHLKGERIKIGEYGMTGHVGATGETYYAPDVSVDPYYKVSDSQTRSEIDIPLKSHGELIGVLNAQHKDLDGFSTARIEVLEALAGHVATAIENARMFQRERMEKERMAAELREAQRIQSSLFPDNGMTVPGFRIEGTCIPCQEVGGDWYDYIRLNDGRLAIVLADVSGKGMGAAMLMSSTRTVLRLVAESGGPPSEILRRVNHVLLRDFPSAKFVTMVYAVLDPKSPSVTFASAGHCYPLLVGSDGAHFLKTEGGLPLGVMEGDFPERTVKMSAGDRLIFYSDGLTEAMNASQDQFGEERLAKHSTTLASSVGSLLNALREFRAGDVACDDITIVAVHRLKPED